MQEYITKAIVLSVKKRGEQDKEVSFLSERLGKLRAVLVGGHRITSKFSPHCDVLDYVMLRIVHKNRYTVTDIIAEKKYATLFSPANTRRAFLLVHFLDKNLPDEAPDGGLWNKIIRDFEHGDVLLSEYLSYLGYGGEHATCARCGTRSLWAFSFAGQEFLCKACGSNAPENALLLL